MRTLKSLREYYVILMREGITGAGSVALLYYPLKRCTPVYVLPRPATMCIPNHIVFWCVRTGLRITCMCTPEYIGVYARISVTTSHVQQKCTFQDINVCCCVGIKRV